MSGYDCVERLMDMEEMAVSCVSREPTSEIGIRGNARFGIGLYLSVNNMQD